MKLYIKQQFFKLGEKFYVKDEFGNDFYSVEGTFFRFPKLFKIHNMDNDLVATIESQMFKLMSHYDIKTSSQHLTVKQNFKFLKPSISITNSDWTLEGDIWAHNYQVVSGSKPIMELNKKWFSWGDSYELNILDKNDALLCLCIAIIVDNILLKAQSS